MLKKPYYDNIIGMLTLGFSPCPNDTFIFYALLNGKIDAKGLLFDPYIKDVEALNNMALRHVLDITKVSCHTYYHVSAHYHFLESGGAFGRGCGPLVIASKPFSYKNLKGKRIAIPGEMTTAYMLLKLFFQSNLSGASFEPAPMLFSAIPSAVKDGTVDAGLIIHESRFTYEKLGLLKIIDLGEWWESETGLPIPLGGIIARKTLGSVIQSVQDLIRESIMYSMNHREEAMPFIKQNSQEISDAVINSHIDLYVNRFSIDMGEEGKEALKELLTRAKSIMK